MKMILSRGLRSGFISIISLICVFVSLAIFSYTFVRIFKDGAESNNTVIKTKNMMFDEYLNKFKKSYSGEEYVKRLSYFMNSLKEISKLNRLSGAAHGLTRFSDMSREEFSMITRYNRRTGKTLHIMKNCLNNKLIDIEDASGFNNSEELPNAVDWRNENKVGPVLDQKLCGGCWAFSIVGLVESMSLIQEIEKAYTMRSIQELIDCIDWCYRCEGGSVADALQYLCTKHLAITTAREYPLALVDKNCSLPGNIEGRRIKKYWVYFNLDETKMQYFLAKHGPLAVVVNAYPWMHYMGGIIQRACARSEDQYTMDHVVQLVGYDRSGSVPYYIARNSWGVDFGDKGYVKLAMNKNICGVSEEVSRLEVY